MKNLLIITTEAQLPSWLTGSAGSRVRVHLPSPELEATAASLVTGLYPGHLIVAGKESIREHGCFDLLARRGVRIAAAIPSPLSYLLPEHAEALDLRGGSAPAVPSVSWCHWPGAIPADLCSALGSDTAVACIELGSQKRLSGPLWQTCHLPPEMAMGPACSILDVFPAVAHALDLPFPAARGSTLAHESPCFAEDWRHSTLAVTAGEETLVAQFARGRFSWLLSKLPFTRRRTPRTFWEAAGHLQMVSASRLKPISLTYHGPRRGHAENRARLKGLLEGHLASYARPDHEEVLNRLRDLGYL